MKFLPFAILAIAVGFTFITIFDAFSRSGKPNEELPDAGPNKFVLEIQENGLFPQSLVYEVSGGSLGAGFVDEKSGTCSLEYLYSVKVGEGELNSSTLLNTLKERIDSASEHSIDWESSKQSVLIGSYENGNNEGGIRAIASQISAQEVEFYFLVEELKKGTKTAAFSKPEEEEK